MTATDRRAWGSASPRSSTRRPARRREAAGLGYDGASEGRHHPAPPARRPRAPRAGAAGRRPGGLDAGDLDYAERAGALHRAALAGGVLDAAADAGAGEYAGSALGLAGLSGPAGVLSGQRPRPGERAVPLRPAHHPRPRPGPDLDPPAGDVRPSAARGF